MKRTIFLLAALLLLATAVPALAQVPADVPADHWAVQSIRELYNRGIFVGYPDDSFRGDRAVTRYELAVVIARLLESLPEGADLSKYVTKTELQTALNNYPTKTELRTTLGNYPTKTELQTSLNNYVTKTEFERRLANLGSREDIAKLQRLIDNLRTELTALGVRVDDVQKRLAALEARVGSLETRVTRLENAPVPEPEAARFSMNLKGGIAARSASITAGTPVFVADEYDRLLDEGFTAGAAFDITGGVRLNEALTLGARIVTINEDLAGAGMANLDSFDTSLGVFAAMGNTRLSLGVFDAQFSPFTLANSQESVLEEIPAFGNDWYFSGAKLETKLGAIDTTVLFSKTRDAITELDAGDPLDPNDDLVVLTQYPQTLFGARMAIAPTSNLNLAANYVLVRDDTSVLFDVDDTPFESLNNRVWSLVADLSVGSVGLYGEYADSHTYNDFNSFSGNAFKVGANVGPLDAWYLKIGGGEISSPEGAFLSYYGDPASATLFNAHSFGMGAILERAPLMNFPNLTYVDEERFDLNNNLRGYGALINLGQSGADMLNPVSPVFDRAEGDNPLRLALGYERLNQVVDLNAPVNFRTYLVEAAFDLSSNLTLLGSFKNRNIDYNEGEATFDQDIAGLGLAYRFTDDTYIALQQLRIDYSEDADPTSFNSTASITKATLNVRF